MIRGAEQGCRRSFWTYCVRNEKLLHRLNQDRNILCRIKRRKAAWVGHILRINCLLKGMMRGIEIMERKGRRHKQLLDDFKETREYWELK